MAIRRGRKCAPDSFHVLTTVLHVLASRDRLHPMENLNSAKRVARVKVTLTKRSVDALEPEDKSWIAWDDRLTGFGCRVQPSGTKSFIVNYRSGGGGRKAPNRRVVIGRYGRVGPDEARRRARDMLGQERGELSLGEASAQLGVDPSVVRRLIRAAVLPARQVCTGALWAIAAADLEAPQTSRPYGNRSRRRPDSPADRHRGAPSVRKPGNDGRQSAADTGDEMENRCKSMLNRGGVL
ncbi:MAG: DUF4102 domain-containing protein [Boseongicola sp. SB0664_bin_43]|uniref:DUF4102 domain-containing protein n=1 Tax=Boseongicola sp. SB0664_bin_43 TaxID=2604844 RepID=A0A6B0XZR1_9RHOB|nr:DUF4102 domain-containing protein [Boseongicola sp. SB0664_bin_43]MYK30252.1 DUF4102 domain-containing protein [Boseongicola sp. SB0670_bin_30]